MIKRRETSVSGLIKSISEKKNIIQLNKITPAIAVTKEQKMSSYKLANEEYIKKGYTSAQDEHLINEYDSFSKTVVINAMCGEYLAGTLTLTDPYAMPCEKLFPSDVETTGHETEVSRFAIDEKFKHNREILMVLFDQVLALSVHILGYKKLYIEVNPRHSGFYNKFLDFQVKSDVVMCGRVNQAPAVLLELDLLHGNYNKPEFKYFNNKELTISFFDNAQNSLFAYNRENDLELAVGI